MRKKFNSKETSVALSKWREEVKEALERSKKLQKRPDEIIQCFGRLTEKTSKRILAALNLIVTSVDIKKEMIYQIKILKQDPVYDEAIFPIFKTEEKNTFYLFDDAVDKLEHFLPDDEGLVCAHKTLIETSYEVGQCKDCKKTFDWYCPDSPDNQCHYYTQDTPEGKGLLFRDGTIMLTKDFPEDWDPDYETDDCCIFCGQPDERK